MLRDLFSLFPAYAGVIPMKVLSDRTKIAFPRIRGGDPHYNCTNTKEINFSPHTRG